MLNEHTLDQLRQLRLDGMVRAIEEQGTSTAAAALSFDDRLTLLVQREIAWRDDRRVARLLNAAKLKMSAACIEDINWRASRSLDRALVTALAGGDWLRHARNLLITGATGSGKTWLACALAHQAARSGFSVLYVRAARLFDELQVAHGDGSFARRLGQLAKLDLIVIDDFAISPMGPAERNDLLELLDDRIGTRSTLITSQLPVKAWHTYLNDPTLADAILDRVVHSSHKIELKGTKSMFILPSWNTSQHIGHHTQMSQVGKRHAADIDRLAAGIARARHYLADAQGSPKILINQRLSHRSSSQSEPSVACNVGHFLLTNITRR